MSEHEQRVCDECGGLVAYSFNYNVPASSSVVDAGTDRLHSCVRRLRELVRKLEARVQELEGRAWRESRKP